MKLPRTDEITVIKAEIATRIRNEITQAQSVLDDLNRGSDEALMVNINNLQPVIDRITALVISYQEYNVEHNEAIRAVSPLLDDNIPF